MRVAIMFALCLSLIGCSEIVRPNVRLLDADSGVPMGDGGSTMGDTGTQDVDGGSDSGAVIVPDSGPSCGTFVEGVHYMPTNNTCGFSVEYFRPTSLNCPLTSISGMMYIAACGDNPHPYGEQVVTPDGVDIICDPAWFHCTTHTTPDFHLTVECTYGGGGTCTVSF